MSEVNKNNKALANPSLTSYISEGGEIKNVIEKQGLPVNISDIQPNISKIKFNNNDICTLESSDEIVVGIREAKLRPDGILRLYIVSLTSNNETVKVYEYDYDSAKCSVIYQNHLEQTSVGSSVYLLNKVEVKDMENNKQSILIFGTVEYEVNVVLGSLTPIVINIFSSGNEIFSITYSLLAESVIPLGYAFSINEIDDYFINTYSKSKIFILGISDTQLSNFSNVGFCIFNVNKEITKTDGNNTDILCYGNLKKMYNRFYSTGFYSKPSNFPVYDIDNDGIKEVIFYYDKQLRYYDIAENKIYTIYEFKEDLFNGLWFKSGFINGSEVTFELIDLVSTIWNSSTNKYDATYKYIIFKYNLVSGKYVINVDSYVKNPYDIFVTGIDLKYGDIFDTGENCLIYVDNKFNILSSYRKMSFTTQHIPIEDYIITKNLNQGIPTIIYGYTGGVSSISLKTLLSVSIEAGEINFENTSFQIQDSQGNVIDPSTSELQSAELTELEDITRVNRHIAIFPPNSTIDTSNATIDNQGNLLDKNYDTYATFNYSGKGFVSITPSKLIRTRKLYFELKNMPICTGSESLLTVNVNTDGYEVSNNKYAQIIYEESVKICRSSESEPPNKVFSIDVSPLYHITKISLVYDGTASINVSFVGYESPEITQIENVNGDLINPATEETLNKVYLQEQYGHKIGYDLVFVDNYNNATIENPENMFDGDPTTYASLKMPPNSGILIHLKDPRTIEDIVMRVDSNFDYDHMQYILHYADGSGKQGTYDGINGKTAHIPVNTTIPVAYITIYNSYTQERDFNIYEFAMFATTRQKNVYVYDASGHVINPAIKEIQQDVQNKIDNIYRFTDFTAQGDGNGSYISRLNEMFDNNSGSCGQVYLAAGGYAYMQSKVSTFLSDFVFVLKDPNGTGLPAALQTDVEIHYGDGTIETTKIQQLYGLRLYIPIDDSRPLDRLYFKNNTSNTLSFCIAELYTEKLYSSGAVGLRNIEGERINPATEDTLYDIAEIKQMLDGKHFIANHLYQDIASGNYVYLYVKPDSNVGTIIESLFVNAEGDLLIQLYQNPTITSNGNAISIFNANDSSSINPTIQIYDGPAWSDIGTLIEQSYLSGTGVQMHPVDIFKNRFWKNSSYLIAIENVSGSNLQYLSLTFRMIEGVK